jgi:hypothetical protein
VRIVDAVLVAGETTGCRVAVAAQGRTPSIIFIDRKMLNV